LARKYAYLRIDQPPDTPYAKAHKYCSKVQAQLLIRRALAVVVADHVIQELREKAAPSAAEQAYAQPTYYNLVRRIPSLKPIEKQANDNLDLSYPEPMRCTVIPEHPAFLHECLIARRNRIKSYIPSVNQADESTRGYASAASESVLKG